MGLQDQPPRELDPRRELTDEERFQLQLADPTSLEAWFGEGYEARVTEYADLGVELRRRQLAQSEMGDVVERAKRSIGASSGGAYWDIPSGMLVLSIASDIREEQKRQIVNGPIEDSIIFRNVHHSRTDLEDYSETLGRLVVPEGQSTMTPVRLLGIDDLNNQVMIGITAGSEFSLDYESPGIPSTAIRIFEMTGPEEP